MPNESAEQPRQPRVVEQAKSSFQDEYNGLVARRIREIAILNRAKDNFLSTNPPQQTVVAMGQILELAGHALRTSTLIQVGEAISDDPDIAAPARANFLRYVVHGKSSETGQEAPEMSGDQLESQLDIPLEPNVELSLRFRDQATRMDRLHRQKNELHTTLHEAIRPQEGEDPQTVKSVVERLDPIIAKQLDNRQQIGAEIELANWTQAKRNLMGDTPKRILDTWKARDRVVEVDKIRLEEDFGEKGIVTEREEVDTNNLTEMLTGDITPITEQPTAEDLALQEIKYRIEEVQFLNELVSKAIGKEEDHFLAQEPSDILTESAGELITMYTESTRRVADINNLESHVESGLSAQVALELFNAKKTMVRRIEDQRIDDHHDPKL